MRRIIFTAAAFSKNDLFLFLARIWFGAMMIKSGKVIFSGEEMLFFEKLFRDVAHFQQPFFLAYFAKSIEFFFGFFLCLGFLTRIASFLTGFTMLVATFTANKGDIFVMYGALTFGLTWLGFYLFFFGPGKFSLDYLIFDRNPSYKR
jgi:uncharacterized membrane protein YphA (DoxX/SURF4 family)